MGFPARCAVFNGKKPSALTRLLGLVSAAGFLLLTPVSAEDNQSPDGSDIRVIDPYSRTASPGSKAAASFMIIENRSTKPARLIGAKSEIATKDEIHKSEEMDGVMRMIHLPDGIEIPAQGCVRLERGGLHIMHMGLKRALKDGEEIELVLQFDGAPELPITLALDNDRKPGDANDATARECLSASDF